MTGKILRASIEHSLEVHGRVVEACLPALAVAADGLIAVYRASHKALCSLEMAAAPLMRSTWSQSFVGRYLRQRDPMPPLR
jgi:hypothetical protein